MGQEDGDENDISYLIVPLLEAKLFTRCRGRADDLSFFIGFILEYFIKAGFKRFFIKDSLFLPTSRTGFLLTYKALVRESLSRNYDALGGHVVASPKLTRPCSDFLKDLASISEEARSSKYDQVIR